LRRSIPRTTHHAVRKNIPIGIATHPYRLFCLLVITFTADGGYVEDCFATAPHQHTHANPSRFRHEVKEKNRETPSAEHRRVQFWVAHGPHSLQKFRSTHSHDQKTTMGKKELLEARRGARTHNLEIKSLTRYRLCQPGLLLLIDEGEGLTRYHIARHRIFRRGSDDDHCSSINSS
jgi:hypothetical protein